METRAFLTSYWRVHDKKTVVVTHMLRHPLSLIGVSGMTRLLLAMRPIWRT